MNNRNFTSKEIAKMYNQIGDNDLFQVIYGNNILATDDCVAQNGLSSQYSNWIHQNKS